MSLADLPEEILSKIVKALLVSCRADTSFYGPYQPPFTQLIWVENHYLVPLASTNQQLRRVCLPDLFSHVVVRKNDEAQSPWKNGLGLLLRIARGSRHIAQLITSVYSFKSRNNQSNLVTARFIHKTILTRMSVIKGYLSS
jgi:hypothetical protein